MSNTIQWFFLGIIISILAFVGRYGFKSEWNYGPLFDTLFSSQAVVTTTGDVMSGTNITRSGLELTWTSVVNETQQTSTDTNTNLITLITYDEDRKLNSSSKFQNMKTLKKDNLLMIDGGKLSWEVIIKAYVVSKEKGIIWDDMDTLRSCSSGEKWCRITTYLYLRVIDSSNDLIYNSNNEDAINWKSGYLPAWCYVDWKISIFAGSPISLNDASWTKNTTWWFLDNSISSWILNSTINAPIVAKLKTYPVPDMDMVDCLASFYQIEPLDK